MSTTPDESADPSQLPPGGFRSRARSLLLRSGRILGLALLTLIAFLLFKGLADPYGYLAIDPGFLFAVALVGAGLLLLRGQEPAYESNQTVRSPKRRSPLGILTISVAFFVCGLMILFGNLGVADVGIGQVAAAALLVVGAGLLVGVWWGRSRFLMVAGAVLVPIVVVTGFIHFPLKGSVGGRFVQATSMDQIDDSYEVLIGTLSLHLLEVDDFPDEHVIDLQVAAGDVTILVPQRVALTVNGQIEWGNAAVGSGPQKGEDIRFANEFPGKPGAGHLEINFNGGIASLYVERISDRELYGPPPRERRREERRLERIEEKLRFEKERLQQRMQERRRRDRRRNDA